MKQKSFRAYYFYSLITLALSFYSVTSIAIVNMDSLHFTDEAARFSADVDLTANSTSGNSDNLTVSFNSQVSWINKASINLAVFGYQYGENNNSRNINETFAHYRYINKLNNVMDWELFTQLESNEFTRLSYRGIAGGGLRFSVFKLNKKHHAYLGIGGFYSIEEIEFKQGLTDHGREELTRANFYFFSKYKVNSKMSFSNALYYQPQVNQFSDFRGLINSKFDYEINEGISLRFSLDIKHDSEPSQTVETTDINYMTGIKYQF